MASLSRIRPELIYHDATFGLVITVLFLYIVIHTHRHRHSNLNMVVDVIYMISWKQFSLPFINTMALLQLISEHKWALCVKITYFILLAYLGGHTLVYWYQHCVNIHYVPKCMICYKIIVVITGRSHCFYDCICKYIYIHTYTIKLFPSLIKCSISCTIEQFKWIMVKNTTKIQVLRVSSKYLTIFSLITTPSTDVTKSLQCKGIFFSLFKWRHLTSCITLMFQVYTYSCGDIGRWFLIFYSASFSLGRLIFLAFL